LYLTNFITQYLTKPVSDWFADFKDESLRNVRNHSIWFTSALLLLESDYTYLCTDECESIYWHIDIDELRSPNQKKVYRLMRQLSHENYVKMRLLIIDNPICKSPIELTNQFDNIPIASELTQVLYESVPEDYYLCKNCGWTLTFHGKQAYCSDSSCANKVFHERLMKNQLVSRKNKHRLKKDIMRFIALPGILEKQIFALLEKQKLKYVPYPDIDKYDAEVLFVDGERWYLDAKSWKNARALGENILEKTKGQEMDADKLFYVVPNSCDAHFRSTVNDYLIRLQSKKKIKCVTLNQLNHMLKGRN
jgi:hypothetical protein